ncbi:hypothetical protein T265_01282 [Opisthorchis viverrini]|uniref:Uncharacterized protein n=1 Tax=Opisthorchis viverrini TaxID=6198 RepID=A0A074ZZT4_OPIVI|nr:hypothetical protein T265_01282 [Opisthorchis viverrini]KER32591.1 hypothetical protein T265_01282 [Opisthorchis viverrini]
MKEDTTGVTRFMEHIPVLGIREFYSVEIMGLFPVTTSGNQFIVIMAEHLLRIVLNSPLTSCLLKLNRGPSIVPDQANVDKRFPDATADIVLLAE